MESPIAMHLSQNIRLLREKRGLSQHQMGKLAGVPRATWANLESGEANPTLSVLIRVANALQVRLEEMIGPAKSETRFYAANELPVRKRGGAAIRQLLPEKLAGLEIDRLELPAKETMTGVPHTQGTREYLTLERGEMELHAAGEVWRLSPGDVVVFRGDQRHAYTNPGTRIAVAYSVVTFAPTGA